jgi:phosphoserine phosphatase
MAGQVARAPIIASDMDGTLSTAETWRGVHAWILANHPSAAADRFIRGQLPRILLVRLGLSGKERFRARWQVDHARLLRGVSADGLAAMGAWVVDQYLWPARRQPAVDLLQAVVAEARAADPATEVILATGAYQPIADAFAARIGADVALGTPLEVIDGLATGELATAVQAGGEKAEAIRTRAAGRVVLAAFGDTGADIPLLSLARRAVAVAPDRALRRAAIARSWEILDH